MLETEERTMQASSKAGAVSGEGQSAGSALEQEMAAYRDRLHSLIPEHTGQFVLIKGSELVGVFPERAAALLEGYQRFGIVPFLVREVCASEPVVYLPNVVA
jgi:hypothetical protein